MLMTEKKEIIETIFYLRPFQNNINLDGLINIYQDHFKSPDINLTFSIDDKIYSELAFRNCKFSHVRIPIQSQRQPINRNYQPISYQLKDLPSKLAFYFLKDYLVKSKHFLKNQYIDGKFKKNKYLDFKYSLNSTEQIYKTLPVTSNDIVIKDPTGKLIHANNIARYSIMNPEFIKRLDNLETKEIIISRDLILDCINKLQRRHQTILDIFMYSGIEIQEKRKKTEKNKIMKKTQRARLYRLNKALESLIICIIKEQEKLNKT